MFCFTSFAVILVLGGGPELTTVEVEIYRLARISFDLHTAAALSIIALVLTLAVMYLYIRLQSASSYHQAVTGGGEESRRSPMRPGPVSRLLMSLYAVVTLLVIAGPLAAIIIHSFREPVSWSGGTVFTLKWYAQILGFGSGAGGRFARTAVEAVSNSVAIGILTTAVAVPVGTALSYFTVRHSPRFRRLVDTLTMAPMTTSSVVLGLGYLLLSRAFSPPEHLAPLFIVGAHAVISYPFVVRTVSSVLRKISPSQRYAAMLLGSPPGRVFRTVELPLITPAMFAGAAFTFGISLGEMNATLVLSSSTTTIPIAIYRLIGSYNFYGACALGTVLVLVSLGSFLLLDAYAETEW
jgi:thiamine transport system permease protein